MRKLCLLLALIGLLVHGLLARSARGEDVFTIAVLPDLQPEETNTWFHDRLVWMVNNRAALNTKMMLQCGDMMNFNDPVQYQHQSEALKVLDNANFPYATCLGNHDTAAVKVDGGSAAPGNVNQNLRNTARYNEYFPLSRYKLLVGTYEASKIDNAYHVFTAGGLNWLVINLELWARTGAVNWAKTIVAKYPNHNVIFLTHAHLNGDSTIQQNNGGYGDNSPQYIFDQAMKPYANVRMVFSGHVGTHGYRTDTGTNGNTIYQFLQCYHDNTANPTRIVQIDTKNGTLKTWVYCPLNNTTKNDGSSMTITGIKWVQPAAPPPPPPPAVPAAPTGLKATPVSVSQINLAWTDASGNETGFKVEGKTGASGAWSQIAVLGANATSFSSAGLSANTTYYYRVRAYNSAGDSAYSNEASATTQTGLPAAPTSLKASVASSSQTNLSWTDNAGNESGFKIERKTGSGGTWSQIATTGANLTSYGNTGLASNTLYVYRVRANNSSGDSAYSNEASATTSNIPPTVQLTGPAGGTIFSAPASVTLTATASDPDGSVTKVEFFNGASKLGEDTTSAYSFTWSNVAAGTYSLSARATDSNGAVAVSSTVSIVVRTPAPVGTGNGLGGEYYAGFYTTPKFYRVDPQINFDWATGSPAASLSGDNFSIFWSGQIQAQYSETYTFHVVSDDGVRLWIDGTLIVDNWTDHPATEDTGTATLVAGKKHHIMMNYYEKTGDATAQLLWSSPSTPKQIIPQSQLYTAPLREPENPAGTTTGLDYAYFTGVWNVLPDFNALTPVKKGVVSDFNLGVRTQEDNFGIRYTGYVDVPYDGTYAFYTNSDDGSRLYIGDRLIADNDGLHGLQEKGGALGLKAGRHALTVVYFEQAGSQALSVSWAGPSFSKQLIPVGRLLRVPPASGDGLLATYFDNQDFTGKTVTRVDATISFDWGTNPPVSGFGADTYSVRWAGYVVPPASGTYTFTARTDDGVRLWVNGQLIIDYWQLRAVAESSGTVTLNGGQRYSIKMEYYNSPVYGVAQLSWAGPSTAKQIVPQKYLYSK